MKYILVLLFLISCGESRKDAFYRGLRFCADYHYMYGHYPSMWLQEQVFKNPKLGEDTLVNHPISKGFISPTDTIYIVPGSIPTFDSLGNIYWTGEAGVKEKDTSLHYMYDSLGNIYWKEK